MVGAKPGSTLADIEITEKQKIGENTEDGAEYDSTKSSEKLTNLANALKDGLANGNVKEA